MEARCAVVLFPPAEAVSAAEEFRRIHDPLFHRIPAHVTVVSAFAWRNRRDAEHRVGRALDDAARGPFPATLSGVGRTKDGVVFVKVEEVDWIEADGNYAILHTGKARHMVRETMTFLESNLPPGGFLRISRSAIVNLERLRELQPLAQEDHAVVLRSGEVLEMTRGIREVEHWLKYH